MAIAKAPVASPDAIFKCRGISPTWSFPTMSDFIYTNHRPAEGSDLFDSMYRIVKTNSKATEETLTVYA